MSNYLRIGIREQQVTLPIFLQGTALMTMCRVRTPGIDGYWQVRKFPENGGPRILLSLGVSVSWALAHNWVNS